MSSLFYKKDNICNICQKVCGLSEDHVPPEGTLVDKKFWISNFGRIFAKSENKPPIKFSQSGIRFKTICRSCNSKLSKYDRKLINFTANIQSSLEKIKNRKKTEVVNINVNLFPNAVMRSVLGHLLAAKTETDDVVPDVKIRSFLLDESLPIDNDIHFLYWLYPYCNIRICRDFAMSSVRGSLNKFGFYSAMKFFPIAFLISDHPSYEGLPSLDNYRDAKSIFNCSIEIPIFPIRAEGWPESIASDNHFVAGGRSFTDSIIAESK